MGTVCQGVNDVWLLLLSKFGSAAGAGTLLCSCVGVPKPGALGTVNVGGVLTPGRIVCDPKP